MFKYIKWTKKRRNNKTKKCSPKQKELLNLFNNLLDKILTDKTLMSSKDKNEKKKENEKVKENGNENENYETLMSSKDDDDDENENYKTLMPSKDENKNAKNKRKQYQYQKSNR